MFTTGIRVFGLCVLVAVVCARPQAEDNASTTTPAAIIKQVDISNPDGSYTNSYETSNGIKVENVGYMKTIIVPRTLDDEGKTLEEEHEEVILVQSGSYTYSDPEGNIITLKYVADENGFQPEGDHLPVAPDAVTPGPAAH